MRQFRAVALQLGVLVALFVVCVTGVAEARATKRLALGQLDAVSATWSITVTDCPYCLGGGQVDVASGSLTSRQVQVDPRPAGPPGRYLRAPAPRGWRSLAGRRPSGHQPAPAVRRSRPPRDQRTGEFLCAERPLHARGRSARAQLDAAFVRRANRRHARPGDAGAGIDPPLHAQAQPVQHPVRRHRPLRPGARPLGGDRPLARHDFLRRHAPLRPPMHPAGQRHPLLRVGRKPRPASQGRRGESTSAPRSMVQRGASGASRVPACRRVILSQPTLARATASTPDACSTASVCARRVDAMRSGRRWLA